MELNVKQMEVGQNLGLCVKVFLYDFFVWSIFEKGEIQLG
jgi:hypothetical protein